MGHSVNPDREYQLLQQRLARNLTGAPTSPLLIQILKLLCTAEEAQIIRRIPTKLTTLQPLARKLKMPPQALSEQLTSLAERGLVIDLEHQGNRYFTLAPIVIGFFEFTFMRTNENLPMKELAALFDAYMLQDDRFARAVFAGDTQIGRAMVREEALPQDNYSEILDWERATHVIKDAKSITLSLCACRHKASHLGEACDRPLETCLSFGLGGESLARRGFGRQIDSAEALDVLSIAKAAGLMQVADNIQHNPAYMCNCCGCCCSMIAAIRRFDMRNAIITSNWIMEVDQEKCVGCGKCIAACPLDAISLSETKATRDADLCLGCGVCIAACPTGALQMKEREQRLYPPESTFDRIITMAIERGKLANLIFEDPELLSHRALGRIVSALENAPPTQALLSIAPLRSTFLKTVLGGAKLLLGDIGKTL